MWHHAVSQSTGIQDIETAKKCCVDPIAPKSQFDYLTKTLLVPSRESEALSTGNSSRSASASDIYIIVGSPYVPIM